MRILLIGDIVGKPGPADLHAGLRGLAPTETRPGGGQRRERRRRLGPHAAEIYHELLAAGVDGITLGDHVYRRREIFSILQSDAASSARPTFRPTRRAATSPSSGRGNRCSVAIFSAAGPGVHAAGRLPL